MKITTVSVLSCILLIFVASCGYRNPYVYTGPDKSVYIANWSNRTSELQLDSDIYQSLLQWYQRSDSLRVVNNKSEADLILAGEILSIDLPSLSYGANNTTREVKLRLRVRYILKDLKSGEILFQEPGQVRVEDYAVSTSSSITTDNEQKALAVIVDELSQDIYLKTLGKLSQK
ncbi:MAG: LptE family protein [Desulfopila sp.]|nr:LptE family protein [Desulfopila sp.]